VRAVLDASVALGAVLADEDPATVRYSLAIVRAIANGELQLPAVWYAEVAGVLLRRVRARTLSNSGFQEARALFGAMRLETHHPSHTVDNLIERAQRYGLQAIDAIYLDLALALDLPIATIDRGLRSAAKAHGVLLVAPAG